MLKEEFLNRVQKTAPGYMGNRIVLDELSNKPDIMGCFKKGELWNVYTTDARGVASIYIDTYHEEEAFDVLHRMFERKAKSTK